MFEICEIFDILQYLSTDGDQNAVGVLKHIISDFFSNTLVKQAILVAIPD